MTLAEMAVGHSGTILSVGGEGTLRLRLLDMGLIPRTRVTVQKIAPLGDPVEIRVRGSMISVRKDEAAFMQVEAE